MRRPLVAGNWKMNHATAETHAWVESFAPLTQREDVASVEFMIAPPFPFLAVAASAIERSGSDLKLAAQNVNAESSGAFTGEVSVSMLVDVGCQMVILGHSERRQLFGETDDSVARKIGSVLDAGLIPVVCVGEIESERESGDTETVVGSQLRAALSALEDPDPERLVLAYEPVWAIGTGKVATPTQAQDVHRFLRSELSDLFGESVSSRVRILYGGSVKPANAGELFSKADIDGFLVGGASLEASSLVAIGTAVTEAI